VTCYELSRVLTLLGYQSELVRVSVDIIDLNCGKLIASVDREAPREAHEALTQDAHVLLRSSSFDRCVDLGLFLRRDVCRRIPKAETALPVVFPLPPANRSPAISRSPHGLLYRLQPEAIPDPAAHVDDLRNAERNALVTACRALSAALATWHLNPDYITLSPLLLEYTRESENAA
jgi:hypothetical protein